MRAKASIDVIVIPVTLDTFVVGVPRRVGPYSMCSEGSGGGGSTHHLDLFAKQDDLPQSEIDTYPLYGAYGLTPSVEMWTAMTPAPPAGTTYVWQIVSGSTVTELPDDTSQVNFTPLWPGQFDVQVYAQAEEPE